MKLSPKNRDVTRYIPILFALLLLSTAVLVRADNILEGRTVHPPVHLASGIHPNVTQTYITPNIIRSVYQLPAVGGEGTIAIVDAYDDPNIQNDFNVFSIAYGLPTATVLNFEIHKMGSNLLPATIDDWYLEEPLDVEWAHAIAPSAKILFVEATSDQDSDMLDAVDYARNRSDVVAISMSWGDSETTGQTALDYHFISPYGATFFAASGDYGTGVSWPAFSANVVSVGGTSLNFDDLGNFISESAWVGSGGGLSTTEFEPAYQINYGVPSTQGFRAIPDVSYNADNEYSPYWVYMSYGIIPGYYPLGGTSCGAPQWAGIRALGGDKINNTRFYQLAGSPSSYAANFRDITSGSNGTPGFYTTATTGYDYVTGLGTPQGIGLLTGIRNWKQQNFDMDDSLAR